MADKIKKCLLQTLWDGTKVYCVDGPGVRNHGHIDFTEGGHGLVYDYVPKKEIYVEHMADPEDGSMNALHEIIEYVLMKYKVIPDYDKAHDATSTIEDLIRSIRTGTHPTIQDGDRLPPHEKPPSLRGKSKGWERG